MKQKWKDDERIYHTCTLANKSIYRTVPSPTKKRSVCDLVPVVILVQRNQMAQTELLHTQMIITTR